jgi:hypothetical protein
MTLKPAIHILVKLKSEGENLGWGSWVGRHVAVAAPRLVNSGTFRATADRRLPNYSHENPLPRRGGAKVKT